MNNTQLQNLKQLIDYIQVQGIMSKKNNHQYKPLKCAYFPCVTTKKTYDQLTQIQNVWQKLIYKASKNVSLIQKTFQSASRIDPMLQRMLAIYRKKILQNNQKNNQERNAMTIIRGDFFLNGKNEFKLIQYNLMVVGLFYYSQKYQEIKKIINPQIEFPLNNPFDDVCAGIASLYQQKHMKGIILEVSSLSQSNLFQQGNIKLQLMKLGFKAQKQALCNLFAKLHLKENKLYYEKQLVSIVYYSTGYIPNNFRQNNSQLGQQECWKVKQMIELSDVIKIPDITMELMNQKRMQTELSKAQVYKNYLTQQQSQILQSSLVHSWDFDVEKNAFEVINMIKQKGCQNFILKPNLQGGGNNIHGDQILSTLQNSTPQERKKYILMEKIISRLTSNILFQGKTITQETYCQNEISRYGILIEVQGKILQNTSSGYLVRTKPTIQKEGGVMCGSGALCLWSLKEQLSQKQQTLTKQEI